MSSSLDQLNNSANGPADVIKLADVDDSTRCRPKQASDDSPQHSSAASIATSNATSIGNIPMDAALRDFFEDATGHNIYCDVAKAAYRKSHDVATLAEVVEFLEKDWPLESTEPTVKVNMLAIHTTQRIFFFVRGYLRRLMKLERPVFVEDKYSSSKGRLFVTEDKRTIIFETPWADGPYLYMTLVKGALDGEKLWRGLCVYDGEEWELDTFWETVYRDQPGNLALSESDNYPFDPFVRLTGWVVSRHLAWAQAQVQVISASIKELEGSLENEQTSDLTVVTRQLNECAHSMRTLRLDQAMTFSVEATHWASELLRSSGYYFEAHQLLHQLFLGREAHPSRLRDRIAEVRTQIAELRDDRQRQRQEQLQTISVDLAVQSMRLSEQSVRIVTETHRDGRTMRGIAWVTIAFLPATFVTSFFGMNFFNGKQGIPAFDEASRNVWIFFVVALPVSAAVLTVFWWWDRKAEREGKVMSETGSGRRK
jgi:hypothetical protein